MDPVDADESLVNDSLDNGVSHSSASIGTSFMGALRKVHSKLKAEIIDGDDSGGAQQEDDAFEAQWLSEFGRLRVEYATKWDTCTHSADEFCGLLFHSSDPQQQAYLLREYAILMEAWRDADLSATSMRNRPDWPAARIAPHAAVEYGMGDVVVAQQPTQCVQTSPSLHDVLSLLRVDYQWSVGAVEAFARRLEQREQIFSCAELLASLTLRRGAFADRAFQSRAYPRLTKSMLRALRSRADALERRHESVRDLPMEPLRVNPQ
jgi:hypothetical protein